MNSIVAYLVNKAEHHKDGITRPDWKAAWTILGRAAKADKADFAAIPAKMLLKSRPSGYQVPPQISKFLPALADAGLLEK